MIRSTDCELSANDWKIQELNECEVRFRKRFGGGPKVRRISLVLFQKKAWKRILRDRRNIMTQIIILTLTRID
jgi:hypothetical protein